MLWALFLLNCYQRWHPFLIGREVAPAIGAGVSTGQRKAHRASQVLTKGDVLAIWPPMICFFTEKVPLAHVL